MPAFTDEGVGNRKLAWSMSCSPALTVAALTLLVGVLTGCPANSGISNATCFACHDGRTAVDMREIKHGVHRNIACSTCHGDGEAHIRSGGQGGNFIVNPAELPFDESYQVCAQCHTHDDEVDGFAMSAHADSKQVSCHECHDIHTETAMTVDLEDGDRFSNDEYAMLCGTCHETQVDQFLESTHYTMGAARCGNCHDLHNATMLRQPKETNALCLQCHSSQQLGFTSEAIVDAHTGQFHPVDPAGSGSSRCTGCHMPSMNAFDPNGPNSHTMFTVPPAESIEAIQSGVLPVPPNSCAGVAGCHDPGAAGSGQPHFPDNLEQNIALQPLYEVIGLVPD
jgi:predicted CXXCH cytochrome family protein